MAAGGVMSIRSAPVSALLFWCGTSIAAAGPVVDAAGRAEALQAEGKPLEALQALDEAVELIWSDAPLAFRRVVLVDAAGQLGTHDERTDRLFRPDEKLSVYVEPVGFGYGWSRTGAKIGFDADLAIENTTGQVITEAADAFSLSIDSAPRRREFGMTLSFAVPYIRPGDYRAIFTVRDQNSSKSGEFEVPFTIAAPVAGSGEAAVPDAATAGSAGVAAGSPAAADGKQPQN
jgi:hypothetical protein